VLYSHRTRTERQIAIGRALLAVFAFGAVVLDSAERVHFVAGLYALIGVYVVYAIVVALLVPRAALYLRRLQVVTLAIDIAVFSVFVFFGDGPTSLFFVFFVFVVITATLRWQWRGVLVTALVTIVAFLGLGILTAFAEEDSSVELNDLIIGVVYLGVVAWLLTFLGLHEARLRQEVGQLAVWSQDVMLGEMEEAGHGRMLAHAAGTMGVPRVVLAREDEEEPWLQIESWEDGHTTSFRAAPHEYSPLVSGDLMETTFLSPNARGGPRASTMYSIELELGRRRGTPVHQAFADRFDMGPVISVPVHVAEGRARLFFLDKRHMSADDLLLAGVVAREVGLLMEESRLLARLRESAAYEERVRLARDLHDGVLQSLTGSALQLETARRLLERDVPAAQEVIKNVQASLAAEQRDLRLFVDQLKPPQTVQGAMAPDMHARVLELRESISRQWGLEVEMAFEDQGTPDIFTDGLATDVYLIVREALVNSARHAHATRARVVFRAKSDSMEVEVEDDGTGFPFIGRRDAASLKALRAGPIALLQRVAARGGTLVVDSSVTGSRVEISLPLETRHTVPTAVEGPSDAL
jgi:signal transduction histidine kinase